MSNRLIFDYIMDTLQEEESNIWDAMVTDPTDWMRNEQVVSWISEMVTSMLISYKE